MNETQAKAQWCPEARLADKPSDGTVAVVPNDQSERQGFCGLSGKPEFLE